MELRFDDQYILVTGASRGIGEAIVRKFAESGANVILHYNSNQAKAEEIFKSLPKGNHYCLQADISDPESVKALIDQIKRTIGRLDVLINNAGVYEEIDLDTLNYEQWQNAWKRTIEPNLTGVSNLCFLASRLMEKQGGGRIINISSRGAFRGEPTAPAYGASKAGLNALGQSLAKALALKDIYVYTIAPGWVDTDMAAEGMQSEQAQAIKDQSPLRRIASPDEIAQTTLFLAAANAYMTGCIVDVNGASYLRS